MRRASIAAVAALVLVPLAAANLRTYLPGDLDRARAQLRYLQSGLADGAAERMQRLFPEGYVFTWALYGLTSVQVARQLPRDHPARRELLGQARLAIDEVHSERARSTFVSDLDPPYGAFYTSWSLYLLAEYVRVMGVADVAPALLRLFEEECARLAAALARSPGPFLQSYPYLAWPADTAVGIAALGIHDQILTPAYQDVVQRWLREALSSGDRALGALSHEASSTPAARGSSLALMSRVLIEADSAFARRQYEVLRRHFVDYRLGMPGVREYPVGRDGEGDVDSGPLILGFSGPAMVVGAAAARVHGDLETGEALLAAVEAAGFPLQWGGARRYLGGLVPVGDAFIAWAGSSPAAEAPSWERVLPRGWRIPAHVASLLLGTLVLWRARSVWSSSQAASRALRLGRRGSD